MSKQIFSVSNKLSNYSVKIGSIDLIKESILSIEVSYRNDTPKVLSKIIVNDIYDLNALLVWRDEKVAIYYADAYTDHVKKEFVILDISEAYDERFNKSFIINLQDIFSYTLEHCYMSKGYNTDPVSALKEYITKLGLDNYSSNNTATIDFSQFTTSYNFTIPKSINSLAWFILEFMKNGYTFYQTKSGIHVKSLADLIPSSLKKISTDKYFTNDTSNQLYKNRIIDIRNSFLQRSKIMPYTRTFAYDHDLKMMMFTENNDNTTYSLSDDVFNLQESYGSMDKVQQHLNFDQHLLLLKDSFTQQSTVDMVVNGFVKNDINMLYELKLKGNVGNVRSQTEGNIIQNGWYVGCSCSDKIVGDSMIQKITLCRADLTKKAQ